MTRVRAIWFLAGGNRITKQKRVRLKAGQAKRVGFVQVATGDQIDQHQALGFGSKSCKVKSTIVETFGKAEAP